MRLFPLSRVYLLIPLQFIKILYNFLLMSLWGGEIFILCSFRQLGFQLLQHILKAFSRIGFYSHLEFRGSPLSKRIRLVSSSYWVHGPIVEGFFSLLYVKSGTQMWQHRSPSMSSIMKWFARTICSMRILMVGISLIDIHWEMICMSHILHADLCGDQYR